MGGGDLNTKKSWHPNTFKNQERVWKAEQADAAEKRKLAELQHEINEERNREELKSIAKKSGLLPDTDGDRKLEWMYKGPQVNRDEYLMGRAVDKNFEKLDSQEKAGTSVGITQPKNHVEHECIPFSIRQYKGLEGTEQVDMVRKLMEDPLMAIKQKEIESRQKILENPVKLKELHRLLKNDKSIKEKKGKKKDKKEKKKKSKKKKHKRRGSSSSGSESHDDDDKGKDLDKLLAEKYKKVQSSMGSEKSEEVGLDKLLTMKYQKLSKELNKMAKPKKSKKKKKHGSSSSEEDSDSNIADDSRQRKQRSVSKDMRRPPPASSRNRSRSLDRERRFRNRSRSPVQDRRKPTEERRDRHHSRSRDRKRSRSNERERRRKSPTPSSSSSESPPSRHQYDSDDERRRPAAKNFGLVSASGKKLELSKRDEVRLYKREEIKAHQSSQKASWSRPEKKKPLTEEEMEAKRRAMLSNADWRDKERKQNVMRYEDEERKQDEKERAKKYDKDFVTKQFKHAANHETVEKRIKSNRNNIQRSGGAMNDHFAKR
ncbi:pre-mRNA-splicing factor CWC25 homolog [Ochlerotatus camptorhynchus]|uniref:pre-mRNA-splicing factor CWC25 homolog n=1 Tax=Ochlerotatus camptorhynchus TaxID=644619 RepID=UPI0031DF6D39